jgi:hypothetical protein
VVGLHRATHRTRAVLGVETAVLDQEVLHRFGDVRVEQPVVDEVELQLRFRRLKALEISTTEVAIPNHSQMVLPMFRIL